MLGVPSITQRMASPELSGPEEEEHAGGPVRDGVMPVDFLSDASIRNMSLVVLSSGQRHIARDLHSLMASSRLALRKTKTPDKCLNDAFNISKSCARCIEPCSFLEPGTSFSGTQELNQNSRKEESWKLLVTIEECDYKRGYLNGTMHADGFHSAGQEDHQVVTFWEGEIVDIVNHSFLTSKWGASQEIDRSYWLKFPPFFEISDMAMETEGRKLDLASHPYIFIRLKEKHFISEEAAGNLTIAGFYYMCISRSTGNIIGYYCDPNSNPYQKVRLQVVWEGSAGHTSACCDVA